MNRRIVVTIVLLLITVAALFALNANYATAPALDERAANTTPAPTRAADALAESTVEAASALDVHLVAFGAERDPMSGVLPEGWQRTDPGTFVSPGGDATYVVLALPAGALPETLPSVIDQMGLSDQPLEAGTREANGIHWALYTGEVEDKSVDFALGQGETANYLVLVKSPQAQHDAYYQRVFLPAVDALKAA